MEIEELQAILEEKDVSLKGTTEDEEEIIYATEEIDESEENEEIQTEEIIEIIEEIEVVEDEEEQLQLVEDDEEVEEIVEEEDIERILNGKSDSETIESVVESMDSQETNKIMQKEVDNGENKNPYECVVSYDADADWEEEENDPLESENSFTSQSKIKTSGGNTRSNTSTITNGIKKEQSYRATKAKNIEYESPLKIPRHDDDDDISPHEIVKNAENNLVYTVLGTSKKQNEAPQQNVEEKLAATNYLKMERLEEGTIPIEGTIYYQGDDMETLYVAHAVTENDQYFDEQAIDQDEQQNEQQNEQQAVWDDSNDVIMTEPAEEESAQDQIFLHEDEDGQLYFKDENGAMQLVYMTEDGNYAFHGNSGDEQESQKQAAEEMALQEYESTSNRNISPAQSPVNNDLDNENDTVTISLIISEDENGLKRTQVIIPTSDVLKCEICQKSFKTQFQLLKHNRLKHAREEDITVRNFPCDLCPKRFPDQNSLAKHRKVHTGDRPFQCLECHDQFPSRDSLRCHMAEHNPNSKPLPCIYCGRRFMDKQTLTKHEKSHLAGEQQRVHNCDICHKSFVSSSDLALHRKNHDPDKKFDCEVCGREFNRLNNLQRHMLVHQQVRGKPVQQGSQSQEILSCDVCGITYKFMSSLTRHMVTSHMNPEKLRQQAEEQRRKRENNYKRYLENRKMYETQHVPVYGKRSYRSANSSDPDDDLDA